MPIYKIESKGVHAEGCNLQNRVVIKTKKIVMQEVLKDNADRKNEKIIEIYNQKVANDYEDLQEELKINIDTAENKKKATNNLAHKKARVNEEAGEQLPKIYSIEDMERVLEQYRKVPPQSNSTSLSSCMQNSATEANRTLFM